MTITRSFVQQISRLCILPTALCRNVGPLLLTAYCLLLPILCLAQRPLTQTIRGTVIDQSLQTPIPGATVALVSVSPVRGTLTDVDGAFRLADVPVGRQTLKISFVGYKDALLTNVVLDAGKELVLTVGLEESIAQLAEVTVKPTLEKDKPLNEMATVSTRTFSVEETQRFAAAVNDPARMATAYAGVIAADDGNNMIIIRGNAPNGLLWRMEGVEIPNPNHFGFVGASSGGISILSAQLLSNSDFMTGAFPAEYGNALSGVFDLKLRRGNNAKRENTIQVGVLGIDVSSEGPFAKNYKGSYLFNYRYSTLGLLSRVGVNVGAGVTTFQDFSFNVYLPTRQLGAVTLFGFGGLSSQNVDAQSDSTLWKSPFDRYQGRYYANTGAVGLTHSLNLGGRAFLKTVLSTSAFRNGNEDDYLTRELTLRPDNRQFYGIRKTIASSTLTYKFSAQHTLRAGIIGTQLSYELNRRDYDDSLRILQTSIDVKQQQTQTLQAFGQWNYRATEQLTFNAGLHYLRLALNGSDALEPRGSIRYAFRPNQSVSLGYGLHSQLQNPALYFVVKNQPDGSVTSPNRNLGFTRAHHVVLAYDYSFQKGPDSRPLRLKAETYYQSLFGIPISADKRDSYAIINSYFGLPSEALRNAGRGRNYGAELTLEQFMYRNAYFLWSTSLYRSEYQGSDAVWRSTRWDGGYATSLLAGKEFVFTGSREGRNSVLGLNVKLTYAGGYRDTPIDLAASRQQQETVYVEQQAFTEKLPDYFRTDVRFSWKRNRPRSTRTLSLDIQNTTNRQNVFGRYFDPTTGTTRTSYQTGLIPILSYRVAF
jgi:hypothetical protein